MTLKCIARISAVHGKSTTDCFKGAIVSDKIIFSCDMTAPGRRPSDNGIGGTTYAKYITCYNERTGGESMFTFNQIGRILKNFEFEEIQ